MKENRVFVIGLSRTGTTSMMYALERLGYKPTHYPMTPDVVEKTLKGEFDWDVLQTHDAYGDAPIAAFYRELDAQCPNSKFILTVREEGPWLVSCERKIRRLGLPTYQAFSPSKMFNVIVRTSLYGRHYFDPHTFKLARKRHFHDVRKYFEERGRLDDLLIMNVKEGWVPLCNFLDVPLPPRPGKFPHYRKAPKLRFK
jgi:hypothetical protein